MQGTPGSRRGVRAKSQGPGQGSQGLRPEDDVWAGESNLVGFPTSLGFHFLSAHCVGSFCLDTHDEVPVLTPIAYEVFRSQSVSTPGFRVSTDQPGLIFSGSDGSRRFRNSSTLLLLGSRGLTKIWEREILQGEEQGAACCSAGPPSKANSPHKAQTPHLFGLRRAWSNLFYIFFSGFGPEPAESAQLEAWLSCSLWGLGKPPLWDP